MRISSNTPKKLFSGGSRFFETLTLTPTYFWLIITPNLHKYKKESTSFNVIKMCNYFYLEKKSV